MPRARTPRAELAIPEARLTPFSTSLILSEREGIWLSRLMRDEWDWLVKTHPEAIEAYRLPMQGAERVRADAELKTVQKYVIHENGSSRVAALGLARVVFDQAVTHPEQGTITGDRIDYWLRPASPQAIHHTVAADLRERQGDRPAFAVVAADYPLFAQQAAAYQEFMIEVGAPALLTTATVGDPFEPVRHESPAQVFRFVPAPLDNPNALPHNGMQEVV